MKQRIYYTTGVAGMDPANAAMPAQGLQVSFAVRETDWVAQGLSDEWVSVPRNARGTPSLGYAAQVVSDEVAMLWAARIKRAGELYPAPYVDQDGEWSPGAIGVGLSVVDAAARAYLDARDSAVVAAAREAAKAAQSVTPRQARQWLIENDLDELLEAGIQSIGASGEPAAVKQSKLMRNWYDMSEQWVYGHPLLQQALAGIGVDRDQFFAEAKLL